ncbi:glycoside hydrolase [Coprinellus micaceus]|uniref:Beta-mannosidase B n=1 Tax=Coprinellus micaceus TaxID=71717 RepID=A0A4Y7SZQ0_COPMI|nr:glycoside hydrolase [Coprinellus micaceus]
MATSLAAVQILDLSSKKWWWKERKGGEGFDELTDELKQTFTPDGKSLENADRESIKERWFAATKFPSEVHVELLERKAIPHPYVAFNEHEVQWVGETEWLYTCTFDAPVTAEGSSHKLTFDGLDTLCNVYLNGENILETDNAFREWVFDTENDEGVLKATDNVLILHFNCAKNHAKAEEAIRGKVRAGSANLGDPSRVYLRKPQYDWRWDWGPELMTCGPYRSITLSTYTARIQDFNPQARLECAGSAPFKLHLTSSLTLAVTRSTASLLRDKASDIPFEVMYAIKDSRGDDVASGKQALSKKDVEGRLALSDGAYVTLELPPLDLGKALEGCTKVKPWWPVGYGDQNLYTFEIKLTTLDGGTIDSVSKRIGWRSVELVQDTLKEPDQYGTGTTFFFKVNGVEVFMGGSNWIPADNFLTTISDERYRKWLTLMRDGGQNMVRIWGGGIYEPDVFYDICDELGILVWQDFQFACGVYPAHDAFVDSVRKEAVYNVNRLKHHPSIALFCGNNEDYQMVLQWGDVAHLPAVVIYEEVLPQVVDSLTGGSIPYHRGSPYGGKGWDTSDPTVGDVHQWNIWGGKELPWQEYPRLGGRFVSEFGIPAFPSMKTIAYWMDGVDLREWYAQSKAMAQHTRAGAFERRFAIVMNENFRLTADLEKHAFNTQVMQAEAVGLAYRAWKREWKVAGKRYCGGILVWQFNDCWPVTSWSLVDYFLRPKPSYYVIARELAPISVGIYREVVQNRDNDRPKQFYEYGATRSTAAKLHIWATRAGTGSPPSTPLKAKLDIETPITTIATCSETQAPSIFTLAPNETTELGTFDCPEPAHVGEFKYKQAGTTTSGRVVVSARLLHPETGEVLARFVDWPQPYRLLDIPSATDAAVQVEVTRAAGSGSAATVRVAVNRPVKCLVLSLNGQAKEETSPADDFETPKWSDNALDVVPFDPQCVRVTGFTEGDRVEYTILQN